jgi:hypothetical protein
MSDIPIKAITAMSAITTYTLVEYQPHLLLSSRPSYLGTFSQLWVLGLILFAIWKVIVWPKFVSPLRHVPGPSGGSWWNGQFPTILAKPTGTPMIEWYVRPYPTYPSPQFNISPKGSTPYQMKASFVT